MVDGEGCRLTERLLLLRVRAPPPRQPSLSSFLFLSAGHRWATFNQSPRRPVAVRCFMQASWGNAPLNLTIQRRGSPASSFHVSSRSLAARSPAARTTRRLSSSCRGRSGKSDRDHGTRGPHSHVVSALSLAPQPAGHDVDGSSAAAAPPVVSRGGVGRSARPVASVSQVLACCATSSAQIWKDLKCFP